MTEAAGDIRGLGVDSARSEGSLRGVVESQQIVA
jgi:hypothetical protein